MSSIVGNPLYDAIVAGRSAGNGNLLTTPDGNAVDDTQFLEQAATRHLSLRIFWMMQSLRYSL